MRFDCLVEEMQTLDNAGMRHTNRFSELQYLVNECEEEEEQRNYGHYSKVTEPIGIMHHKFACIASNSCLR